MRYKIQQSLTSLSQSCPNFSVLSPNIHLFYSTVIDKFLQPMPHSQSHNDPEGEHKLFLFLFLFPKVHSFFPFSKLRELDMPINYPKFELCFFPFLKIKNCILNFLCKHQANGNYLFPLGTSSTQVFK